MSTCSTRKTTVSSSASAIRSTPHQPVRKARDKLADLSADAETRRLAFMRERALLDEASLFKDAREEGREEGHNDALRPAATTMIR